jgi:hypothetical protein
VWRFFKDGGHSKSKFQEVPKTGVSLQDVAEARRPGHLELQEDVEFSEEN